MVIFPSTVRPSRTGIDNMSPDRVTEALETLASILPVAVVGIDQNNNVDFWSPGAAEILGIREEEVLGKPAPLSLGTAHDGLFERANPVRTKEGWPLDVEFHLARRPSGGMMLTGRGRRPYPSRSPPSGTAGSRA